MVDTGAEQRLCDKGASLLPIGIKSIDAAFDRGAVIRILSPEGTPIAVGITNYASDEIGKLLGVKTDQIEQVLGYTYGDEIIHRDNMVLLKKANRKTNGSD